MIIDTQKLLYDDGTPVFERHPQLRIRWNIDQFERFAAALEEKKKLKYHQECEEISRIEYIISEAEKIEVIAMWPAHSFIEYSGNIYYPFVGKVICGDKLIYTGRLYMKDEPIIDDFGFKFPNLSWGIWHDAASRTFSAIKDEKNNIFVQLTNRTFQTYNFAEEAEQMYRIIEEELEHFTHIEQAKKAKEGNNE